LPAPDGQIDVDLSRRRARQSLSAHENRLRRKTNFASHSNAIPPVQSFAQKYLPFVFSEIDVL
jgi:hypothetical protein